MRPHLDYGNMVYDEAYNQRFHRKLESIQYNACLAIIAIRGSSREKLYHELGLESLQHRHWYRKLCLFYNIFKGNKDIYRFNLMPTKNWIIVPEIQVKLLYFILNITFSIVFFFFFFIQCY